MLSLNVQCIITLRITIKILSVILQCLYTESSHAKCGHVYCHCSTCHCSVVIPCIVHPECGYAMMLRRIKVIEKFEPARNGCSSFLCL